MGERWDTNIYGYGFSINKNKTMKKQTLNEQLSRIKSMIGKVMNESFEDAGMKSKLKIKSQGFDDDHYCISYIDENGEDMVEKYDIKYDSDFVPEDKGDFGPEGYGAGHGAHYEISLEQVSQVEPERKEMSVEEFEDYITSKFGSNSFDDMLTTIEEYEMGDGGYFEKHEYDLDEEIMEGEDMTSVEEVIDYVKGVSEMVEEVTEELASKFINTEYWSYIKPMYDGLRSVSDMESGYTRSDERSENVASVIDLLKNDFEVGEQSSVEDDDYDEKQERNYGVEDI